VLPTTQRAILITSAGGPEVLRERPDWPVPSPDDLAPTEVLIEAKAAGINRHDCNQRAAGPDRELNPVPGLEVSGRIVACGKDVSSARLGEAVVALTDGGSYAQYVTTDQDLALPLPEGLDWITGAALPEALFTIWFNFVRLMRLSPGDTAMIHGGSSGVGTIGIQLLRALGHPVFATAGTAAKRQAALDLGCTAVFDYADPDLGRKIYAATGNKGIDLLLDTSGGAHIVQDILALAPGGRISLLSAAGGKQLGVPLRELMARRVSITGAFLRSTPLPIKREIADQLREKVWPLLGQKVRPLINRTYDLSEASRAHAHMESNQHIGKIILTVRP